MNKNFKVDPDKVIHTEPRMIKEGGHGEPILVIFAVIIMIILFL